MQDCGRGGLLRPACRGGKVLSVKIEVDGAAYEELVKMTVKFVDDSIIRLEEIEKKLDLMLGMSEEWFEEMDCKLDDLRCRGDEDEQGDMVEI